MAFLPPDDQDNDWYGWACNQAGHAGIIGIGMALPFLWLEPIAVPFVVMALYGVVWEWAYQIVTLKSKNWKDAVVDTMNVGAGAALIVSPDWATLAAVYVAWLIILAIGVAKRI